MTTLVRAIGFHVSLTLKPAEVTQHNHQRRSNRLLQVSHTHIHTASASVAVPMYAATPSSDIPLGTGFNLY